MTVTELKEAKERYLRESKRIRELTAKSMIKETPEEQKRRIKRLLLPKNYNKFFDYYFGIGSGLPLADAPSADFHLSSYLKVFKDPFIVQQRRWYRGAAKSIHTNVGNVLHLKENQELFFALLIGQTEGNAKILLSDLQMHLENNQRIIEDFGPQVTYGNWSDGEFQTTDGKSFKALGLNQPFRGLRFGAHRPDFASVDDCEDRKRAKNVELTQEYGEKITGDLVKAFHLRRGRLIMPNNYIVKDGLMDFVANKFKGSKHLHIDVQNLSDEHGNPTWYQRLSKEDVIDINAKTDYYTSQREDYNNPIEEGKLFKPDWIQWADVHGNRTKWNGILCHWDLSYKKQGDYKAAAILGFGFGKIHVLDVFCRKCDLSDAVSWHFDKMIEYTARGLPPIAFFDATAAQEEVFLPVFQAESKRRKFDSAPLPAHVSTDKHLRIEATLTDVFFNKLLVWDKRLKDTEDMKNALNQILSFEKNTKAHDDFPDTLEAGVRLGRLHFALDSESTSGRVIIGKQKTAGY